MNEQIIKEIANDLNITEKQVSTVLQLLQEDNTIPFIARYTKISRSRRYIIDHYKEKKKTKATEAIALGLEPLAKMMMTFPTMGILNHFM